MASPNLAPGGTPMPPQAPAVVPTFSAPTSFPPQAAPSILKVSPPAVALTGNPPQAAPPITFQVSSPPPPLNGSLLGPSKAPRPSPPPSNFAAVPIVSPVAPPPTPATPAAPPPRPPSRAPPAVLHGPPANPPISSSPPPVATVSPPHTSPPPFPPPGTPLGPPLSSPPVVASPPPQTMSPPTASPPPLAYGSPPPFLSPPPGAPPFSPTPPIAAASSSGGGGVSKVVLISAAAGGGVLVLLLLALCIYCICAAGGRKDDEEKRKRRASGTASSTPLKSAIVGDGGSYPNSGASKASLDPSGAASGYGSNAATGSWYAYDELARATDNFSLKNKLGEGGFGKVYKGVMPDGKVVAVKVLTVGGGQGEREFRAEVEIISRVHHRHLVTLLGYCIVNAERLLVYEYVPLGSLEYNLRSRAMDWTLRMRVALGVAKGLAYLHEDCHPRIFHRDIKSSNILIDEQYEAQLADFGLAKLAPDSFTHVSTRVMGTFGYLAPEYATSGKLTDKSDVFSYGVVLLELISGRKPVDETMPPGQESLVEFARPLLESRLEEVIDPRLEGRFEEAEMRQMAAAAALCVRNSAPLRPRMGQVVQMLQSSDKGFSGEGERPGNSQLHPLAFGGTQTFDADQYSAEMRQQYGQQSQQQQISIGSGRQYSNVGDTRVQSNYGSGVAYRQQSGQELLQAEQGGRTSAWSQGSTENLHSGGMPKFSGELEYGQGKGASDRLQEGR